MVWKMKAGLWLQQKHNLPLFVLGWEDSTIGNIFASHVIDSGINASAIKGGIHYMTELAEWYENQNSSIFPNRWRYRR